MRSPLLPVVHRRMADFSESDTAKIAQLRFIRSCLVLLGRKSWDNCFLGKIIVLVLSAAVLLTIFWSVCFVVAEVR